MTVICYPNKIKSHMYPRGIYIKSRLATLEALINEFALMNDRLTANENTPLRTPIVQVRPSISISGS